MDIQNTKVTMSLEDFDELRAYKRFYGDLVREIRNLTYVDQMTSDQVDVIIKKQQTQDFIAPFAARDSELDDYPKGVKVKWK